MRHHTLTGDLASDNARLDERGATCRINKMPAKRPRQERTRSSSLVDVDAGPSVRAVHTALSVLPAAQRKAELQAVFPLLQRRAAAAPGARHRGGA